MAYKSLYRKYRPTNFDEVVGQKYIIQTIKNSILNEKVGHAYIFSGPRGIGKTTIARIVAKAVNCPNEELGNPCNECLVCQSVNEGSAIDVVEIDAASNNGVDEMRGLLEKVNFLPASFKYKIYIIDEVHMLSMSAFNALLKTLEEPPLHVIFILATTEPHKVPATILSRCQRFDFKPLSVEDIKLQLTKVKDLEEINIEEEAIDVIAEAAEGGMRDALSILDQVSSYGADRITAEDVNNITGRVSNIDILNLIKAINDLRVSDALEISNEILNAGKEVGTLVQSMLSLCRDIVLYQSTKNHFSNKLIFSNETFINVAENIKRSKIFKYVDILNDIQNKIKTTNSPKIYLEVGIVKMVSNETNNSASLVVEDLDLTDIYDRIRQVELLVNQTVNEAQNDDLGEFKDFTKSKLEFLEEVISKYAASPKDLEERIEMLEEQVSPEELERRLIVLENKLLGNVEQTFIEKTEPNETNNLLIERLNKLEGELYNRNNVELTVDNSQIEDLNNRVNEILKQIDSYKDIYITKESIKEHTEQPVDLSEIYNRLTTLEENVKKEIVVPVIEEQNLNEAPELIQEQTSNESIEVESFELEEDDLFNSYDETYNEVSEVTKIKENYLVLFNKVMELQKEIETQKEEVGKHISMFNELNEYVSTLPTSSIDEETLKKLEEQITNVKEYSIKVGSRCSALEEKFKNIKAETEQKPIIQRRPQPFETPLREEQQIREQTIDPSVTQETKEEVQEVTPEVLPEGQVDDTAKAYDIRVIENILHQSRDRKNMEDKEKINSVWPRLASLVPQNLSSIALTLSEGKVVVNGANYFIIVYPKASICNHLMTEQNHFLAKEVLRITLQKEYDFIALPINTWHEKSTEYKGQYHMGIRYPSLTPINNPELKVINITKTPFQTQGTTNYNKAAQLFGKGLIREVK